MIYYKILYPIEFLGEVLNPGVYCVNKNSEHELPWKLVANSETVWEEDDEHGLRYLKNKGAYGGPHEKQFAVDTEEFMWVKLSARQVR